MKIYVAGSMQFIEKKIAIRDNLNKLGHMARVTSFSDAFIGKSDKEKEKIKISQKNDEDAIRACWDEMQGDEAILVANFDKYGIKNYVGGNAFLELGYAYVMNQKLFLLNPIPDMIYTTEIIAMKPIIINGDLSKIK